MIASAAPRSRSPWPVVVIGLVALAIAMGIGRFAFTPMMPLMLRDGTLSAVAGTEWAAANYAGYLAGALSASLFARDPRRGLQIGLVGVVLSTLAIAWIDIDHNLYGLLLRTAAGVLSAWVLVCASSWCLSELARRHATALGGWMYIGVGSGIALTGLMTWLGGTQPARMLWIELGLLAALGSLYVLRSLGREGGRQDGQGAPAATASVPSPPPPADGGNLGLVLCYSAFGFGYIIPATYLPTMARQLVDDPLVFGLTWPIFGTAAALSVAVVARWLAGRSHRRIWAVAQGIMAIGTALPLLQPQLWVLAASAVLVGGTFMVTTMGGLQLARERAPANPTALLARMTAGFAAGQIAGPLLVRLIGTRAPFGWSALDCASALATLALAVSALWLWKSAAGREPAS